MKKNVFLLSLLSLLGLVTSCYDDSELRERIEKLENTTANVINQQITALQSSIDALKSVDFELKNQIATLETTDTSHQNEIAALKEKDEELLKMIDELQAGIDSLRAWVEDILKNYSTTEEMNEQFAAVQEQINKLNVQVAMLLATPDILFDVDGSVAYSPGTTIEVKYTLVNTDEETEVECISDAGWKAGIIPAKDGKSGIISVTTPSEGGEGKVLVFVSTKLNTAMRVLRFEQGTLTVLTNSIAVEPQDTLLTIDARTNVDYKVVIPTEAQSWIELISVDTRATMRTDAITLSVKANTTNQSRSAIITFVDTNDKELSSFTIYQRADVQANNEIWYIGGTYIDIENNMVLPTNVRAFGGATLLSNTYSNGKWIMTFDRDVEIIGRDAFNRSEFDDNSIVSMSLPKSVKEIEERAFYMCDISSINIPESVEKIGSGAFSGSYIRSIILPEGLSLSSNAFVDCRLLVSINIPNSVLSISFSGCVSLENVILHDGVQYIDFFNCTSLSSIVIPESVTFISDAAFCNCISLSSVTIPESVVAININAFSGCSNLASITIPSSVNKIEYDAFEKCYNLTSVICLCSTPPSAIKAFPNDVANYCTLYVPAGCVDAYAASEGWKNFKEIKEIE